MRALFFLSALAIAICGAVIVSTGWTLRTQLNGHYQTNLEALTVTINELDQTIAALQRDTVAFNDYLRTLREQLGKIGDDVDSLNKETDKLSKLAGVAAPQILSDSSKMVDESSKIVRQTANDLGKIPNDLLATQRASMYAISGSLNSISAALNSTSTEIGKSITETGSATQSTLVISKIVLEASEEQLADLQNGSLKRLPTTMAALSDQLQVHLQLIRSSYDLVRQVTTPIIALGLGLLFIGLRWMLVNLNIAPTKPN